MDVNNLEKYCFRYDSSICKGYIDEERLKELTTLIQKERENAVRDFASYYQADPLRVMEYLSQTKGGNTE